MAAAVYRIDYRKNYRIDYRIDYRINYRIDLLQKSTYIVYVAHIILEGSFILVFSCQLPLKCEVEIYWTNNWYNFPISSWYIHCHCWLCLGLTLPTTHPSIWKHLNYFYLASEYIGIRDHTSYNIIHSRHFLDPHPHMYKYYVVIIF